MAGEGQPLVSVCMGVRYQREDLSLLERAIRSIQEQSYSNWEFLICERDSTPAAKERLNRFEQEDPRIHLIKGEGADTLAKKLNRCIHQSTGMWLARMDDDDFSYPERFERQLYYLKFRKEYDIAGCLVREVGGKRITVRMLPEYPTKEDFRKTLPFVHPALLLRREAVLSVGGYSEDTRQIGCEDYDLLLRLYAEGHQGANLQEVLLDYSIVSSQLSPRKYRLFVNEFFTRWHLFHIMGLMPQWILWAGKPLIAGLLPRRLLYLLKHSGSREKA